MVKSPGLLVGLLLCLAACGSPTVRKSSALLHLTGFKQNYVRVEVSLERNAAQNAFLTATFAPDNGYHLYSKDLPREGIYGEGRPTLLELTPQSQMRSLGELTANAQAEVSDMGPGTLLVYPAGPVTLRLEVTLPAGAGWHADTISVTYEACSQTTCLIPVIGKTLTVRVPGSQEALP